MEKKFWWFTKKNEPASDMEDYNKGYYGDDLDVNAAAESAADPYSPYSDQDISDVSVVLTGTPAKDEKEPLMKRTFTPASCTDSQDIVDAYKDGRVIVICIEELDKPNFLRLFDYLMGAVQALDGELRRVDRDTVVLLPSDFDDSISIDELEEEDVSENENAEADDGEDNDTNDDSAELD